MADSDKKKDSAAAQKPAKAKSEGGQKGAPAKGGKPQGSRGKAEVAAPAGPRVEIKRTEPPRLKQVYEKLGSRLQVDKKETEISGLMALVAAVLAITSAGLSLLWFNRIL